MPTCRICQSDANPFYSYNSATCKTCLSARAKRWFGEHPDEFKEMQRRAYLKRPAYVSRPKPPPTPVELERRKQAVRDKAAIRRATRLIQTKLDNPHLVSPYRCKSCKKYHEALTAAPSLIYNRLCRECNRAKAKGFLRRLRDAHPERYRAMRKTQRRNCKSHKRGIPGSVSTAQWKLCLALSRGGCQSCHAQEPLTMDHVTPLSQGGAHDIRNLQALCMTCNVAKGVSSTDYRTHCLLPWAAESVISELFPAPIPPTFPFTT